MTDKILINRAVLQQALDALDIGRDAAFEAAQDYHMAMRGYRPKEHKAMDAEVIKIDSASEALREALAAPQPAAQPTEPVARACNHEWEKSNAEEPWLACAKCGADYGEAPQPAAQPLSEEAIKTIFLENGFEIKSGLDDLKPYVYQAARAIEKAQGIGKQS